MILRELLLQLGLDIDEKSIAKGVAAGTILADVMKAAAKAALHLVDQFVEVIHSTAEAGLQVEELSQQLGIGIDELQNMTSAGELMGVSTRQMANAMGVLARNMKAAKEGGEEQSKVFRKLKVETKDSDGKLRHLDEVMLDLADRFKEMPDGTEKTALSMQVLGRAGKEMIPLLNKGSAALREMANETPNLTEEQVKAGAELILTQKRLAAETRALWQRAVAPLLPAINHLLERWFRWKKANAAIMAQKIQQYIGYVISAIDKLSGFLGFLIKNAEAVKTVLGVGGLILVFNALSVAGVKAALAMGAAWLVAMAPFIAIAAVVAGILLIFDDLRVYQKDVDKGSKVQHSLFGEFRKSLDDWLKPQDKDPWFVIVLKYFVQLMRDAIEIMLEFDRIMGNGKNAVSDPTKVNAASPKWKRDRVQFGPKTKAESLQDDIQAGKFVSVEDRFLAGRRPTPTAPPPVGGATVSKSLAPNITIVQQPGQSSEDLATTIDNKIRFWWEGVTEEANASVGP